MQTLTRKGSFDAAHRVMDERVKCFNLHGHLYQYEITLGFTESHDIGFAIDFKDIKIICNLFDELFDHGTILNPKDEVLVDACTKIGSKVWLMSLNGEGKYCNPTAENISKEMFLLANQCIAKLHNLSLQKIRVYETPNCYVDTGPLAIPHDQRLNVYRANKGVIERIDQPEKFYYSTNE